MQFDGLDMALSPMQSDTNRLSKADAKEVRKKLRNRQSAQRARDRQKERMKSLERQVEILNAKNQQLISENNFLKNLLGGECDLRLKGIDIKSNKGSDLVDVKSQHCHPSLSPARKHNTTPGRIYEKLKILDSEDNLNVDGIGMLSPLSRNKVDPTLEWPSPQLKQTQTKLQSKSPESTGAYVASLTAPSAEIQNNLSLKRSLPLPGSQIFNYSATSQILRDNCKNLFPYYAYASAYAPSLTVLNLLTMVAGMKGCLYTEDFLDQGALRASRENVEPPAKRAKQQLSSARGASVSPPAAMAVEPPLRASKASIDKQNSVNGGKGI